MLCGQFVGRAQAMHHHVRVTHNAYSTLVQGVQAKATQLANMHSAKTPCAACGVTFVSQHSCNVWFQVAMLIVHGPKQHHGDLAPPEDALKCEICGLTCDSGQLLHSHLQTVHKLVSTVWHESRDSVDGQPACNHCHMLFQTMDGLRSHINQGRCQRFNPDLPTAPSPVAQIWSEACCKGMFEEMLRSPHNKLRLSLQCQCCPKRYTRSSDLSAHLQSAHPEIWASAQALAFHLVQRYYGTLGCVCNPSCNVARLQHVCLPFWQLAMQFTRIPKAIFQPAQVTTTELARTLPPHVPVDLRANLEYAFLRYDFTRVWTDVLLLDALSGSCFLCGHDLLAPELSYHLHEAHHGMHPVVKMYVQQLLPHALSHSDNDCACFACGQFLNMPDDTQNAVQIHARQKLVQAHLRAQCPSLLQLAVLLTHVHHGSARLSHGQRGSHESDPADVPELGTAAARSEPEAGTQPRSRKTAAKTPRQQRPQKRRALGSTPQPSQGHPTGPAIDGEVAGEGGSRPAGPPAGNDIHLLLQLHGSKGHPSSSAPTGRCMAQESQGGIIVIDESVEASAPSDGPLDPLNQAEQAPGGAGGFTLAPGGAPDSAASGEQNDPLHGLEPTGETPSDLRQNASESGRVWPR